MSHSSYVGRARTSRAAWTPGDKGKGFTVFTSDHFLSLVPLHPLRLLHSRVHSKTLLAFGHVSCMTHPRSHNLVFPAVWDLYHDSKVTSAAVVEVH